MRPKRAGVVFASWKPRDRIRLRIRFQPPYKPNEGPAPEISLLLYRKGKPSDPAAPGRSKRKTEKNRAQQPQGCGCELNTTGEVCACLRTMEKGASQGVPESGSGRVRLVVQWAGSVMLA